jgi:geranylgeranyl reductase family protein
VTLELRWPDHPDFPSYGYVVRRRDLDEMVAERAVKAGATLWSGAEAVAPLVEDGLVTGAAIKRDGATQPVRATYVVVADGANSRFGRAVGTVRDRTYPLGMAIRGYFTSPFHDEPWIESHLDLRDREGRHLPGYGWIFPVGDGTVNVGVGLLSTFAGWKDINTSTLMDAFIATAPARWGISPETSCGPPTGGMLPTGGSSSPNIGPTWLVVGDAAGSVNPFNGEGISVAYETGRFAAAAVSDAIASGDGLALTRYVEDLEQAYALYWKVARLFVRAIGNPAVMRELTRVGMQSRPLMEWVLRIMANLLRPTSSALPKLRTRRSPRSSRWCRNAEMTKASTRVGGKVAAAVVAVGIALVLMPYLRTSATPSAPARTAPTARCRRSSSGSSALSSRF